jgi:pyruvate dehydrogenase E2 component (dihydrolipoamide acetyltransferase)
VAKAVIMPKFGMDQEEGTVAQWLKQEGETVEKGEPILEVETDKINMEVEAPAAGILAAIRIGPGVTVPIGEVIAYILKPGEEPPQAAAPEPAKPAGAAPVQPDETTSQPKASPVAQRMAAVAGLDLAALKPRDGAARITKSDVEAALATESAPASGPVGATPAAKRRARELGLDLAQLRGRGPAGRIQLEDVEDAAMQAVPLTEETGAAKTAVATETAPAGGQPLSTMRRRIAQRLGESWQTAPHIMLTATIDMGAAEALRTRLSDDFTRADVKPTPTILIAKAVAAALARHPALNGWLTQEEGQLRWQPVDTVNLGVAVALPEEKGGGLIVPVVRQAETLGLIELGRAVADVARRAREGKLLPDDMADGTFTVSNLGMVPVDHFTAIINPPQVAILAVGRTAIQPQWNGEAFEPRPTMAVTLSADHRIVDGAVAAAFLADLKAMLEEPLRLLL